MVENKEPSSLLQIPVDHYQLVLSFLVSDDLLSLSLVSKGVKKMCSMTYTLIHGAAAAAGGTKMNANLRISIPNMRNLDPVSSMSFMRRTSPMPASRSASLGGSRYHVSDIIRLTHLLNRFQNLRRISLYNLSSMGDEFIPIINQCGARSSLVHLELHNVRIVADGTSSSSSNRNNRDVSNSELKLLDLPTDKLSHVEVEGTLFCTYKVIQSFTLSQNLQTLKLSGCRALTDDNVHHLISRITKLKTLGLEQSSKLMAPRIESSSLETLLLGNNPLLRDISMIQCKNLKKVDFSFCSSIGNEMIERMLQISPKIETLILRGCMGFSMLDITSSSDCIKSLDLGSCMALEQASIISPHLKSLEIGLCVKLKSLLLHLDVIDEIDLSMLTLKQLSIVATGARRLDLSGCCHLKEVTHFDCPKLLAVDICGTDLDSDIFQVRERTKVKSGGDAYDWSDPFAFP